MSFRITGLAAQQFSEWFTLSDEELRRRHARRVAVDRKPGFPCRISLTDAEPGDDVLLINYMHLAADSPYRASHAIYIRAGETTYDATNEIPPMLRSRLLSLRAFDAQHMLSAADVVDGTVLEEAIERMFVDTRTQYMHVHFAKPGCYAARIARA